MPWRVGPIALSVVTNNSAILAMNSVFVAERDAEKSMERLSSGRRLNTASDNVAGISIASRLTASLRGTYQAIRNALDAQALAQTAESGHKETENILQRMREIAVQAANDTNNEQDRLNLHAEFSFMSKELDRIGRSTTWAGQDLLGGDVSLSFQVGANTSTNDQINISLSGITAADLGVQAFISTSESNGLVQQESPSEQAVAIGSTSNSNIVNFGGMQQTEIKSNVNSTKKINFSNDVQMSSATNIAALLQNGLVLKNTIAGSGLTFATIDIKDEMFDDLETNLADLIYLNNMLDQTDGVSEKNAMQELINQKQNELTAFIASFYTASEFNLGSQIKADARITAIELAEVLDTTGEVIGDVVAIEIDFDTLFQSARASNALETSHQNGCCCDQCLAAGEPVIHSLATTTSNAVNGTNAGSSGNAEINSLLMNNKWDFSDPDGELTYSYYEGDVAYEAFYPTGSTGNPKAVSAYGGNNTAILDKAFELWDDIVDFEFLKVTEVTSSNNIGELRVAYTDRSSGAAAFAFGPGNYVNNGDVFFEIEDTDIAGENDFLDTADASYKQSFNFFAAIHEIGHALGLSHPFDGSSADGTTLDPSVDNFRKSVMSYVQKDRNLKFSYNDAGQNISETFLASSPMMLDIEAVTFTYGRENDLSKATDTIFNFSPTNENGTYEKIHTIVDSGGADVFDASSFTRASSINLTPGTFSSLGHYSVDEQINDLVSIWGEGNRALFENAVANQDASASASNSYYPVVSRKAVFTGEDNVGISAGSLIEKAIAGSGDDTITGNSLDNYLTGGAGDDTISGGAGFDIAIFTGDRSEYTITNSGGSSFTIEHSSPAASDDGIDVLSDINVARFTTADGDYEFYNLFSQVAVVKDTEIFTSSEASVSLTTADGARGAMSAVQAALEKVNTQRSKLGTFANRISHIVNNLTNVSSNLAASRGRIRDTDFALETLMLAKNQILHQSSTAMLANANATKKNVLALLRS